MSNPFPLSSFYSLPIHIMKHIRQGDLLFTKVDALPEGTPKPHDGAYVLALGEMTGHQHVITAAPETMKVVEHSGVTYISLEIPAPLTHEEHKAIEMPSGVWRMTFEREYDPFLEAVRSVKD